MTFLVMMFFMYQHPMSAADTDGDGKISQEEYVAHAPQAFAHKDKNKDGYLTREDRQRRHFRLLGKFDTNEDRVIDEGEIAAFLNNIPLNEDGTVNLASIFQQFHPEAEAPNEDRLAHLSQFLDRDENGSVEPIDFELMFDQIPKNEEGNIELRTRSRQHGMRLPFPLLADENEDKILTLDEWNAFIANLPTDENGFIVPPHRERRHQRQNPFDTDQDGQVSIEELEAWFSAADQDGNGELTEDEIPQRRGKRARRHH